MHTPQTFLRAIRSEATGLWHIAHAALDRDRSALACQARTSVLVVAYTHSLGMPDVRLAFGWHDVRPGMWRHAANERHATMLATSPSYAANHSALVAFADAIDVYVTIPAGIVRRANA